MLKHQRDSSSFTGKVNNTTTGQTSALLLSLRTSWVQGSGNINPHGKRKGGFMKFKPIFVIVLSMFL